MLRNIILQFIHAQNKLLNSVFNIEKDFNRVWVDY